VRDREDGGEDVEGWKAGPTHGRGEHTRGQDRGGGEKKTSFELGRLNERLDLGCPLRVRLYLIREIIYGVVRTGRGGIAGLKNHSRGDLM